jgi:hypothetical protein
MRSVGAALYRTVGLGEDTQWNTSRYRFQGDGDKKDKMMKTDASCSMSRHGEVEMREFVRASDPRGKRARKENAGTLVGRGDGANSLTTKGTWNRKFNVFVS